MRGSRQGRQSVDLLCHTTLSILLLETGSERRKRRQGENRVQTANFRDTAEIGVSPRVAVSPKKRRGPPGENRGQACSVENSALGGIAAREKLGTGTNFLQISEIPSQSGVLKRWRHRRLEIRKTGDRHGLREKTTSGTDTKFPDSAEFGVSPQPAIRACPVFPRPAAGCFQHSKPVPGSPFPPKEAQGPAWGKAGDRHEFPTNPGNCEPVPVFPRRAERRVVGIVRGGDFG